MLLALSAATRGQMGALITIEEIPTGVSSTQLFARISPH
jgi:hypothetical protein